MRLCGLDIPNEQYWDEPTASNRIHNMLINAESDQLLAYDNLDIAAALSSIVADAEGIARAIKQHQWTDINNLPIPADVVKLELNTLNEELAKIAAIAQKILTSEEGQKRWPKWVANVHGTLISIPNEIDNLSAMSTTFKDLSDQMK